MAVEGDFFDVRDGGVELKDQDVHPFLFSVVDEGQNALLTLTKNLFKGLSLLDIVFFCVEDEVAFLVQLEIAVLLLQQRQHLSYVLLGQSEDSAVFAALSAILVSLLDFRGEDFGLHSLLHEALHVHQLKFGL